MAFKKVVIEPTMCKKKTKKSIAKKPIRKSVVKKKRQRKSKQLQKLIKSVKGKHWKQL